MIGKRWLVLGSLVAVAVIAALVFRSQSGPDPVVAKSPDSGADSGEAAGDRSSRAAPVPVALSVVEGGQADAKVRAWGTLHPYRQAVIVGEVSGRVRHVSAGLGDRVRAGQRILEIDPELYRARVREAEARLESANIAADKAARDATRAETLFERGTISDTELESSRSEAARAEADRAAARAALEQAKKSEGDAVVTAPFAGHVATRAPDVGSSISMGTPLVTVVDIEKVRVDVLISEQDLPFVQVGSAAQLVVEGAPGRTFTGIVTAVGPQADPTTRQFPVEIETVNPADYPLKGGMVARVEIVHASYDNVPLVPVEALLEDEGTVFAYTVSNGRAARRVLRSGPRTAEHLAVLDGLAVGDSVVVLGQTRLAEGSRVRVEEVQ